LPSQDAPVTCRDPKGGWHDRWCGFDKAAYVAILEFIQSKIIIHKNFVKSQIK
jgi:hypothetical protein